MKNIHILPTDEVRFDKYLVLNKENKICIWDTNVMGSQTSLPSQNIYITSDEQIKEDDWMIRDNEKPIKVTKDFFWDFGARYYKIILTTDLDLIKDGVQAIDNEFLEWFVKNPSCEWIEVQKFNGFAEDYLIVIPKEESKPIHQKIIDIVGGEDKFREIAKIKPKK